MVLQHHHNKNASVVTANHDLENWCMHDVIGLEHGMCVEHGGALVVLW